jgi:S-adenosylmethionine hydrolase
VFVTFLSDFGLQDDFVGTCHGVIARIAPEVRVIDITHGIPPQQLLQGALVHANTLPYMPEGVHLAVVDPVSAASGARSRFATRAGACTSGRTTGCSCRRRSASAGSPRCAS